MWAQGYDPFGNSIVSTFMAAVPVVVLLGCIAFLKMKAHVAALLGIASSLAIAILAFGMPTGMATRAAAFGAAYGLMPIGWIILNAVFLMGVAAATVYLSHKQTDPLVKDGKVVTVMLALSAAAVFFVGVMGLINTF